MLLIFFSQPWDNDVALSLNLAFPKLMFFPLKKYSFQDSLTVCTQQRGNPNMKQPFMVFHHCSDCVVSVISTSYLREKWDGLKQDPEVWCIKPCFEYRNIGARQAILGRPKLDVFSVGKTIGSWFRSFIFEPDPHVLMISRSEGASSSYINISLKWADKHRQQPTTPEPWRHFGTTYCQRPCCSFFHENPTRGYLTCWFTSRLILSLILTVDGLLIWCGAFHDCKLEISADSLTVASSDILKGRCNARSQNNTNRWRCCRWCGCIAPGDFSKQPAMRIWASQWSRDVL